MSETPLLIVGLGNPGPEYEHNRHNIGFMALEAIVEAQHLPSWRRKFKGDIIEGKIDGRKCVLLKPETFMNLSGQAVVEVAGFYKIPASHIWVFHDELDLAPGKVRIKDGGGSAGHNGLKSIEQHLGTADFHRVRLGIGHPGDKDLVTNYVLHDFAKAERVWLDPLLKAVGEHVPLILDGKGELFMTRVAAALPKEEKEKKETAHGL